MSTMDKLQLLRDIYPEESELDQILGKLLDVTLSKYRLRLERYEHELRVLEQRHGMNSDTFYQCFEAGELGDSMDFFEWAGMYELYQDIVAKIARLEQAT